MVQYLRFFAIAIQAWFFTPTAGIAQPTVLLESLPQFSIEELHERLIIADRKSSKEFEDQVEKRGGAIVIGAIAEVDPGRNGTFFVWLRTSDRKIVGRFMLPAGYTSGVEMLRTGQEVRLACEFPYRSYSGHVSSSCRIQ